MDKALVTNRPRTQWIKHLLPLMVLAAVAVSGQVHAEGSCGKGKVLEVKEGGWNGNGLMIKIDYSVGATTASNHFGYIYYRATLNSDRLKGIRAVAYLAMATDKVVDSFTHDSAANGCTNADELTIIR